MAQTENVVNLMASIDEVQQGWHELNLRVKQLEAERTTLEHENKTLRSLLERVIEHRQKSHGELVLLLTGLVSKLPINDVGVVVSKLVEHNTHVTEMCSALAKGKAAEGAVLQPTILKELEQVKRELHEALKPVVEEMVSLETPLETEMLRALIAKPETFFAPATLRATRCFIKGQVPRERVVREFGEAAFLFFNDMTTDPKLNPRPKPDEISLAFKSDFEALFQQNANVVPDKREALQSLYQKIQRSKGSAGRAQRQAFLKLSFLLELLHYYENQSTEAPDVLFAQRLPALVEQLVLPHPQDPLDEKLISQAESLMAFVASADHRHAIINNIGKGGGVATTLRFVLKLRQDKVSEPDIVVAEFVKHLIPPQNAPAPQAIAAILRLVKPDMQRLVIFGIMDSDRLRKEDAEALGKAVGKELGIEGLEAPRKAAEALSPEMERQLAWEKIKELITARAEPSAIATAVRARLHAKYDSDEMKQSWITLTEADPISFIRVFCQLPYLADGRTDPVARTVMETYVTRLTHEKYAAIYLKVLNSLKNMFRANPHSPTLINFLQLVKWIDGEAANKISADIGMVVPA